MSHTQYGYGDEATWPAYNGDPNDPRAPECDYDEEQERYDAALEQVEANLRDAEWADSLATSLDNLRVMPGYKTLSELVLEAMAADSPQGWERLRFVLMRELAWEAMHND